MSIKEMMPWRHGKHVPVRRVDTENAFEALQRRIDRMFEDFRHGLDFDTLAAPFGEEGGFEHSLPRVDVAETDDEVQVTADLPGMEEKDIEVTLSDHSVTIRGEKTTESEEKKSYYLKERTYGSFHRIVPLPEGADLDKAKAVFKKGVLTVTIPKTAEAKSSVRKVAVHAA